MPSGDELAIALCARGKPARYRVCTWKGYVRSVIVMVNHEHADEVTDVDLCVVEDVRRADVVTSLHDQSSDDM